MNKKKYIQVRVPDDIREWLEDKKKINPEMKKLFTCSAFISTAVQGLVADWERIKPKEFGDFKKLNQELKKSKGHSKQVRIMLPFYADRKIRELSRETGHPMSALAIYATRNVIKEGGKHERD